MSCDISFRPHFRPSCDTPAPGRTRLADGCGCGSHTYNDTYICSCGSVGAGNHVAVSFYLSWPMDMYSSVYDSARGAAGRILSQPAAARLDRGLVHLHAFCVTGSQISTPLTYICLKAIWRLRQVAALGAATHSKVQASRDARPMGLTLSYLSLCLLSRLLSVGTSRHASGCVHTRSHV